MSGLFWDIATSDIALAAVGILFVATWVVARTPVRKIPAIAPYALLAGLVSYLALADLALCVGFRIADERAAVRQLKNDLAWSDNELEQQKATAEDADRIAKEKAAQAQELQQKVSDYEAALERATTANPASACALTDDDIDRLRALSRRTKQR
jgi:hypothetical protein